VSEPTERRRQALAHSPTVWRKKMALRPAPERAKALVPRLKQVFRGEGVPPELVWIAEVESSLNPNARNPCGATGLFQFMPATAKRFGLSTSPVDERRDPDKSARAAARYLRELYRQLQAWPLAFAGYNAGEGRVRGLLARHKGRTFEDIAPYLPTETRMYVPKVVAVIAVREGVDAATLPPPATRAATVRAKGPGSRSTAPLIAGRPRPPAATRSL
jgi:membrane-bound lytic murein transglycosylase D